MSFKTGAKVSWKWMNHTIDGIIEEIFYESVSKNIKGKKIKRNGSKENPACLVLSNAGNYALKLSSELTLTANNKNKPRLFS